jgi:signal transduction histidine kinase
VRSGVGGSGLGLAVVRDLVAHAGGTVRVESAPGGGARFVAELPMVGPVTA